MNVEQF